MKNFLRYSLLLVPFMSLVSSCGNNQNNKTMNDSTSVAKPMSQGDWGEVDGKKVYLYTLTNKNGTQIKISNYGGTITSWITADKNGKKSNIVLGFDSLKGYREEHPPFFGATVGRYGNRIAKAKFTLDGKQYTLAANNGPNSLHGGKIGFDKVVWDADKVDDSTPSLTLHYLSKDGEEGFPGNLKATVTFTLTDNNELQIVYDAETDKATPINLTNHSYFNLTGDVSNTILDQVLMINADKYTPVDTTLIPTGELKSVEGTPFDFRQPKKIGRDIAQVKGGYDHNFVLSRKGTSLELAASVADSISGRKLEVYTTEPGVQFYTGNFLDGKLKTSDGKTINQHTGMCLETQHFPDSPNEPKFPSTILKPGAKYHTETTYKISVSK